MRKVILGVAVSLDGFIEGPNGEYDWCFNDQDYGLTDFSKRMDALVMGRKTYDVAQAYDGPSPWSETKTYVFSRTLKSAPKGTEIVSGDVVEEMIRIKNLPGKDIWMFGGADLLTQFINNDLIDEYWLSIHPILLGAGKPLFQNISTRKTLKLIDQKTYETGLVSVVYSKA
jgi:dihydrofolate reductase